LSIFFLLFHVLLLVFFWSYFGLGHLVLGQLPEKTSFGDGKIRQTSFGDGKKTKNKFWG
jgi:hypothetical protein